MNINKPREDGKKQERFRITSVEFDCDKNKALAKKLAKRYTGKYFLADDEHDADECAADIVSDASGWCVFNVTFEPYHPFDAGITVFSRTRSERGTLTGSHRHCSLEGCTGMRLATRWKNGKITWPCTKGMTFDCVTGPTHPWPTFSWRIG